MKFLLVNIFLITLYWISSSSLHPQIEAKRGPSSIEAGCLELIENMIGKRKGAFVPKSKINLSLQEQKQYRKYLSSTLNALEDMRGQNGLIVDKAQLVRNSRGEFSLHVINSNTSPTNIGLDLLIQIEQLDNATHSQKALRNLENVLATLSKLEYHQESGLFFNWYSTDLASHAVMKGVSSVDNIHLALALWTIREKFSGSDLGGMAKRLLDRMDFSSFFDRETGLIKGQISYINNEWIREDWAYRNFGSEARSIYALSWALGLMRTEILSDEFINNVSRNMQMEIFTFSQDDYLGNILKTWDGGSFQQHLPNLLIGEDQFSGAMRESFEGHARFLLERGKSRGLPVPAAHSASSFGVDNTNMFGEIPCYNGKSGNRELVSTDHVDVHMEAFEQNWERVFTPHAAFLASPFMPSEYLKSFEQAEKLGADNLPLFNAKYGWLDGYHVQGDYQGQSVPVILSLDHSMIALSILKVLSDDQLTPSARALFADSTVRKQLEIFYDMISKRFSEILNSPDA